ncbi:polymorphic toxin-type HINT domain-containing protein [Amycolatopsis sp. NPDC057786]|uniref:polymorphic toxin-type HINT domain-containing protein n=1 Tax=Amycolatopsis sp. NPDC057786 TaxID=3346250 RepID=UPI00366BF280
MDSTRDPFQRSLLYTVSGGAISIFFILAAAQQAQAAPGPISPPSPGKNTAQKEAEGRAQVENRKRVDAGPSGNNEQRGKKARVAKAAKAEEKRQVENRKRVDAGPSGNNEQRGKKARIAKAEKAEEKRQVENRKRVDAGPSGNNEQRGKKARIAKAEKKEQEKRDKDRRDTDAGRDTGGRQRDTASAASRRSDDEVRARPADRETGRQSDSPVSIVNAAHSTSGSSSSGTTPRRGQDVVTVRSTAPEPTAEQREEQSRRQARNRLAYANPERPRNDKNVVTTRSTAPEPTPRQLQEQSHRQARNRLAYANPEPPRNGKNPVTVRSTAPEPTAEQREEQSRRQARNRLAYANPEPPRPRDNGSNPPGNSGTAARVPPHLAEVLSATPGSRPEDRFPLSSGNGGSDRDEKPSAPVRMPERLRDLLYGDQQPQRRDPLFPAAYDVREADRKPVPSHLKDVLAARPTRDREERFPLLMPRSDKSVPRDGSSTARPLPVRPPEKSVLAQVEESVEDTVGGALSTARNWAQDEIDRERAAEDKNADWLTWGRRAAAGGYASLHDGAQQAGEALDLLNRAKDGDPEAQRQIEKYAQDAAEGIANTATDAWNDPQGTWNRAVESAEKAAEDFKDAPASGIGGILSDVVGPGKFARPLKAVDAAVPDRDGGRAPEPNAGAPGTRAGEQAPDTTAPAPRGGPADASDGRAPTGPGTDSRGAKGNGGRGPVVIPMPVTDVPNVSRADRKADRPSKNSSADDGSSRHGSADAPSRPSDERTSGKTATGRDAEGVSDRAGSDRTGAADQPDRCPTNSFVPGTLVLMADGSRKPIESIKVGDLVAATNPETGTSGARSVAALITGSGQKDLVDITIDTDGDAGDATGTIVATDGHPFWNDSSRTWTDAEDLTAGERLRTPDGRSLAITATRQRTAPQTVHNLSITGINTYYVVAGEAPVLVHNAGCVTTPGRDLIDGRAQFHIIHGDVTGGGHKWPGQAGKSVFPPGWDTDKILDSIAEVATSPRSRWTQQTGKSNALYTKNGDPSRWKIEGVVDGVNVRVIYEPATSRIVTGFPVN